MIRKNLLAEEIPDELFEKEMFRELDSSFTQEQYYLGVYTLTDKNVLDMQPGEESVRYPHRKERTSEEMFERDYISQEEKDEITEQNMKLIDKCVGQYMPRSDSDKKLFCIEDVIEACHEGFIKALDEFPRLGSTAKFSTYAYELMSNSVKDMIKRARARKRGLLITESLDTPIASGSSKEEDEVTVGELIGTNMNDEDTDNNLSMLTMQSFVKDVFKGMDEESVLILTYKFGIGYAEYEHTEAEIADILDLPPAVIRRKLNEAMDAFKLALYSQGLLSEAETILVGDMGYTKKQVNEKLSDARQEFSGMLFSPDAPFITIGNGDGEGSDDGEVNPDGEEDSTGEDEDPPVLIIR